jgi:uncharacterized protein (DUF427 family)
MKPYSLRSFVLSFD